jgi:hypothetical protein
LAWLHHLIFKSTGLRSTASVWIVVASTGSEAEPRRFVVPFLSLAAFLSL